MKFSKEHQPQNRRKPDKLTAILKEWLNKPYSNSDITISDKIVEVLVNEAINGNLKAIQLIFDRIEGKPIQMVEGNNSPKIPDVIYLPADTGVQPFLNESEVIDPTETN